MSARTSLQLSVSVPFSYTKSRDEQSGITLIRRPPREMVYKYARALALEIKNCAAGLDEVELSAIRFVGGTIHFFWQQDLKLLMETLRASFHWAEGIELSSYASPGDMTAGPRAVLKEYGFRQMIDMPSFDLAECRSAGIPYKAEQSAGAYEEAGVGVMGLRTSTGLIPRSEETWSKTLAGVEAFHPEVVEFTQSACAQDERLVRAAVESLKARGYCLAQADVYALKGKAPTFQHRPQGDYLGVGLDARCRYDGYLTHNTASMEVYLQYSDDFQKLYQTAESVAQDA